MAETLPAQTPKPSRVTVLMATYNGRQWIDAQVDSILGQRGVEVVLVVSDDGSSDGTLEHLHARALEDPRIRVLPPRGGRPGVTANFLHLFTTHIPDDTAVAFSDQDDVWREDKLLLELAAMHSAGMDVVSSNAESFSATGARSIIKKNQPLRKWDHVFEAAGPGSTYLFSPQAHARIVDALSRLDYSRIGVHDWYLYAIARAIGLHWTILEEATVEYRQHEANVLGANSGPAARKFRLERLMSGFYREQFLLTARAIREVSDYSASAKADLDCLIAELENGSFRSRLAFARRWRQIRRKPLEGIELACSRLAFIW